MSDIGIGRSEGSSTFNPATIGLMILVGVIGFFGSLVLGTYAPDLQGNGAPGGHALSNSAVGYSGIVQLASATGRNPKIVRNEQEWNSDDLVVATPPEAATPLGKIIAARSNTKPTLYVLPKWDAVEDRNHKGWVRVIGLVSPFEPEGVLAPGIQFAIKRHTNAVASLTYSGGLPPTIAFAPPAKLQVIARLEEKPKKAGAVQPAPSQPAEAPDDDSNSDGTSGKTYDDLAPIITDGSGGIVLGKLGNLYVLSDPDLLDNAGLKHEANAASALALLDWLNAKNAKSINFDVVLNGLGQSKDLLRLAFDPPLLAMTLTLAVMVVLIGIRAAGRFGAPRRRERAIAFGKTALVDNGAMLVRKGGKASRLGGRYAAVIRDQAVSAFGVSARLSPQEVDGYLDGLGGTIPFTRLAEAAEAADRDGEMLAAAKALHAWKREVGSDD